MNLILSRLAGFLSGVALPHKTVIYGSGELGKQFQQLITQYFPQVEIIGFIDGQAAMSDETSSRVINGIAVYQVNQLTRLRFDSILVASFRYQDEIMARLRELGGWHDDGHVFVPDGNLSELTKSLTLLTETNDIHRLTELVFEHPEKVSVWVALQHTMKQNQDPQSAELDAAISALKSAKQ